MKFLQKLSSNDLVYVREQKPAYFLFLGNIVGHDALACADYQHSDARSWQVPVLPLFVFILCRRMSRPYCSAAVDIPEQFYPELSAAPVVYVLEIADELVLLQYQQYIFYHFRGSAN